MTTSQRAASSSAKRSRNGDRGSESDILPIVDLCAENESFGSPSDGAGEVQRATGPLGGEAGSKVTVARKSRMLARSEPKIGAQSATVNASHQT